MIHWIIIMYSQNPMCRFIGEESFSENGAQIKFTDEPTWMIDPIDGTSNFVHGWVQLYIMYICCSCTCMALSMCCCPILSECTVAFEFHDVLRMVCCDLSVMWSAHAQVDHVLSWLFIPSCEHEIKLMYALSLSLSFRFPFSAVSIAMALNKQPVVGVVYNFVLDQLFSARKGAGALVDGKPIRVSKCTGEPSENLAFMWCISDYLQTTFLNWEPNTCTSMASFSPDARAQH